MVRPERFELPTYSSGGCRSIQLSYGRVISVYIGGFGPSIFERVIGRRNSGRKFSGLAAPALASSAAGAFCLRTSFVNVDCASAEL